MKDQDFARGQSPGTPNDSLTASEPETALNRIEKLKTEHTPGPWIRSGLDEGARLVGPYRMLVCDGTEVPQFQAVARVFERTGETDANARLIAAAPTMLAAIKEYIKWGAMTGSDRDLFDWKFRDAIDKAEGRQS